MFDVGGPELLLIILVVVILFGPQKIPEVAQMLGKGIRKFREAQDQFKGQMNDLKTEIEKASDIKEEPEERHINEVEVKDLKPEHFSEEFDNIKPIDEDKVLRNKDEIPNSSGRGFTPVRRDQQFDPAKILKRKEETSLPEEEKTE